MLGHDIFKIIVHLLLRLHINLHFCCLSGDFIYKVSSLSPAKHFIIHSRKALLKGLTPAENRSIPPLKYVPEYWDLIFIVI